MSKELKDNSQNIPKKDKSRRESNVPYKEDFSFLEDWKNHRFRFIRITYHILASIWTVVMVVGGFIAWLISFLFI